MDTTAPGLASARGGRSVVVVVVHIPRFALVGLQGVKNRECVHEFTLASRQLSCPNWVVVTLIWEVSEGVTVVK